MIYVFYFLFCEIKNLLSFLLVLSMLENLVLYLIQNTQRKQQT